MIAFLTPLGLAALAALALPIALHLIRRSDDRLRDFAALRWLEQQRLPRRLLRLYELPLLILRLLLLTLLALLLARPVWQRIDANTKPWVFVAAGIDIDQARAEIDLPQAEWRQLAPGFPALGINDAAAFAVPLASLIRELDAGLPAATPLTLVVPAELGGLDAQRLQLSHKVDWKVLPGRSPEVSSSPHTNADAPLQIVIRYDEPGRQELLVAHALLRAWQSVGLNFQVDEAMQSVPLPDPTDWLFWLGGPIAASAQRWIANGGMALLSRQPARAGEVVLADTNNAPVLIAAPLGRGHELILAPPLTTAQQPALLAPDFPQRLRMLLQTVNDLPARASAAAVVPELSSGYSTYESASIGLNRRFSLDGLLSLGIALLFLLERLWATRRREPNP